MPELAYVDGVFGPIVEAKVSIEDRGYQFGDGVYEVLAVYDGKPFLLDRHLQRFRRSAEAIYLSYDFDAHPLEPIVMQGLRRSELRDAMVYLQITRGVAPRSHVIPPNLTPTVVMTFKPLPALPDDVRRRGARVMTTPDIRWANCFVKAITLLANILVRNEAIRRGYDDALFMSETGELLEATSSNVFVVKERTLSFPPRTQSILHGVTQGFLLECAEGIGVGFHERPIDLAALRDADEVFLCATTIDVLGVTSIDDRAVGAGTVGPLTQALYQEFGRRARGRGPE